MPTTACDACRLRKVKCNWPDDSAVACEFCTSIGFPCHTAPRQRQRAKKRARSKSTSTNVAGETIPPSKTGPRRPSSTLATGTLSSHPPSPGSRRRALKVHHHRGSRLLGVSGLTRQALDSCVDTFFSTIGQVFSLSQSQTVFSRRMRVQLYYSSGLDIPAELADIAHEPASRLLILAVACRGAYFSPYPALAEDLYAHCAQILSETDVVITDYLDAIDSILLLSELTIQPRHATATTLDPLGKGTVVDLALYHRLHIAPPPSSPDFQRRLALFTRVWAHDAIRSASAHTCYRIADDEFGWPLPSSAEDVPWVILTLATREICATLLSPRAKGMGISDEVVRQALTTLANLRGRMKVTIESFNACLAPGATPENEPLYPFNAGNPLKPMEQLFMLSTHDWLHLVVWVAVQESSERHPGRLSASTIVDAESATLAACEDMAVLSRISTSHGLHICGPRSIRNHMAAFALFLARVFASIASPTVEQSSRHFALAETLNYGVRSATYYPDSDTLANTLRMALYRAVRVRSEDAARVAERGLEGMPDDAPAGNSTPQLQPSAAADSVGSSTLQTPRLPPPDMFLADLPRTSMQRTDASTCASPGQFLTFTEPMDLRELRPSSASSSSSDPASASLDWGELMDTLKGCGFELPLGPL